MNRIKDVKIIDNYNLVVTFQNDIAKTYDVSKLFEIPKFEAFLSLKEIKGLFEIVKVDPQGFSISWNDNIDLDAFELWENGIEILN